MSNDNGTPLTRRRFLTRGAIAASAVALPYYIPSSALGRNGAVAPSERIVMGGIGLGGRGSYDLGAMLNEREVQWVAVCDVRKSHREAAKKVVDTKHGTKDCAAYADLRQLLAERTDVDAVLIATGDRWHALASTLAMRAGKDVYCGSRPASRWRRGRWSWRPRGGMAGSIKPAPSGSASRITCSPSKWPEPAGWARFIPSMRIAVGATGCVMTGCRRNLNRPRMKWTGTSGSVPLPGGLTTVAMSMAGAGTTIMISLPMSRCGARTRWPKPWPDSI